MSKHILPVGLITRERGGYLCTVWKNMPEERLYGFEVVGNLYTTEQVYQMLALRLNDFLAFQHFSFPQSDGNLVEEHS